MEVDPPATKKAKVAEHDTATPEPLEEGLGPSWVKRVKTTMHFARAFARRMELGAKTTLELRPEHWPQQMKLMQCQSADLMVGLQ